MKKSNKVNVNDTKLNMNLQLLADEGEQEPPQDANNETGGPVQQPPMSQDELNKLVEEKAKEMAKDIASRNIVKVPPSWCQSICFCRKSECSIHYLHQAQPLRRSQKARVLPLAAEQRRNALRFPLSPADLHQRADQDPHHVVKKAVTGEQNLDFLPLPLNVDGIDSADGGLFHSRIAAERGEIMLPRQQCRPAAHGV